MTGDSHHRLVGGSYAVLQGSNEGSVPIHIHKKHKKGPIFQGEGGPFEKKRVKQLRSPEI